MPEGEALILQKAAQKGSTEAKKQSATRMFLDALHLRQAGKVVLVQEGGDVKVTFA